MVNGKVNLFSAKAGCSLQIHHCAEGLILQFQNPFALEFAQFVADEGGFRVFEELAAAVQTDPRMTDKNKEISNP